MSCAESASIPCIPNLYFICIAHPVRVKLSLLCVSLSLAYTYLGVMLVHYTSLFVLHTKYVLWYTQPVLRSYLLFVSIRICWF